MTWLFSPAAALFGFFGVGDDWLDDAAGEGATFLLGVALFVLVFLVLLFVGLYKLTQVGFFAELGRAVGEAFATLGKALALVGL